jgi:hypothetical protein
MRDTYVNPDRFTPVWLLSTAIFRTIQIQRSRPAIPRKALNLDHFAMHVAWAGRGGRPERHHASRTPRRPAKSVTYCHATRPDRAPRVWLHSIASARRSASEIAMPKASQ